MSGLEKQTERLSLKGEPTKKQGTPVKKKEKEEQVLRPDEGTVGTIQLFTNYVRISKFPNLVIYQYNYAVLSARNRKPGKNVRWKLFNEMTNQKIFGKCFPIYDRNDLIYCSAELPWDKKDFNVTLPKDEVCNKTGEFNVTIKFNKKIDLQCLKNYIDSNYVDPKQRWDGNVQSCIHALNTYINYKVRTEFLFVGRGIYPSTNKTIRLTGGADLKQGYCQSLRAGWSDLLINVDVCSNVFYPPGNVINFVEDILQCRKDELRRGIEDDDRKVLLKSLKGVKFRVTHRGNDKKSVYTVDDISKQSADIIKFRDDKNVETSVSRFFAVKYKRPLEFGFLPCIVTNGQNNQKNSFPMEVCEILPDQPFRGNISDLDRADMIKYTCVDPSTRFRSIRSSLGNVFRYNQDDYLKSINTSVDTNSLVTVNGRLLPTVSLAFRNQQNYRVEGGRWNFVKQLIQDGKKLFNWSVLVLSKDNPNQIATFTRQLREVLNRKGMNVVNDPPIMIYQHLRDIRQGLLQAIEKARINKGEPPQLILVVMKERSRLYSDIKRIAETDLGVRTQCILSKNLKKPKGVEQLCVNVGLKINAKLGGKNCSLSTGQISFISSAPTMVFGADVFHSGPNELHHPSIAAVCASMDPQATIYSGRYNLNMKPRNETIEKLDIMVIELLKAFRAKNGRLPQRILFYRDGVSEGQFRKVMEEEVDAMRKAFKGGYGDNPPKLTFVIVQKRHNTRFMPVNNSDKDKTGNCKSGTIVASGIVVKQEFDFFLQSHTTLKGTGRPTHYRVLVDDNKFTADEMYSLTNKLCYLNARCTAAISVVTPAYYAHLIANRARHYTDWDGSSSSESSNASCAFVKGPLMNHMYFI